MDGLTLYTLVRSKGQRFTDTLCATLFFYFTMMSNLINIKHLLVVLIFLIAVSTLPRCTLNYRAKHERTGVAQKNLCPKFC